MAINRRALMMTGPRIMSGIHMDQHNNKEKWRNRTEMPWISFPYFGNPMLIQDVTVDLATAKKGYVDGEGTLTITPTLMRAYRYAKLRAISSLDALKSASARVPMRTAMFSQATQAGAVRQSPCGLLDPRRTPFVGEPDLALHTDRCCDFLGNTDQGGYGVDGEIVADDGALAFAVLLCLWDTVCASVAHGPLGTWERRESGGREGGEHVGHCVP
jgi:hypothetical protein